MTTTETPKGVAEKLNAYLENERKKEAEGPKFLAPFKKAGWRVYGSTDTVRFITALPDGREVRFYAMYRPSNSQPILIQFDQAGANQYFDHAEDAIAFVNDVIANLRR